MEKPPAASVANVRSPRRFSRFCSLSLSTRSVLRCLLRCSLRSSLRTPPHRNAPSGSRHHRRWSPSHLWICHRPLPHDDVFRRSDSRATFRPCRQKNDSAGLRSGDRVELRNNLALAFAFGSVALLMTGRFLGGITAASQAISLAALVDVCPPAEEGLLAKHGLARIIARLRHRTRARADFSQTKILPPGSPFTLRFKPQCCLACLNFALLLLLLHEARRPPILRTDEALPWLAGFSASSLAFRKPGLRKVSLVFLLQELGLGRILLLYPGLLIS